MKYVRFRSERVCDECYDTLHNHYTTRASTTPATGSTTPSRPVSSNSATFYNDKDSATGGEMTFGAGGELDGDVSYDMLLTQFSRSVERKSGRKKAVPRVLKVPAKAADSLFSGKLKLVIV